MSRTVSPPTPDEESYVLTYVVPFIGVLLIAMGIPSGILGGYVVMQDTLGLCGEPDLEVQALEDDEPTRAGVGQLSFEDLSPAEQRAFEEALDSPLEEGLIDGELANEERLLEGVVIEYEGERYYARIASLNSCLEAEPLLFPIGVVGILIGIVGVLTPPIYRQMAGFEERMHQ